MTVEASLRATRTKACRGEPLAVVDGLLGNGAELRGLACVRHVYPLTI